MSQARVYPAIPSGKEHGPATRLAKSKSGQKICENLLGGGLGAGSIEQCYLTWPVKTSTSPSGRDLSHYHVLFHPHGIDRDDDPEHYHSAEDTKEQLWDVHHAAISYATTHGFCFNRWRGIVNTMIEKEAGNPKLHRLRVIHLYENDYNLILGVKFREFMHDLEDNDEMNSGCYGSRANRTSLDPVFIELMQYDYCLLTRYDEIDFVNDAKSCYDCIIVPPSNVAARSRGLNRRITKVHGEMLEKAEYRIKTQLGISKSFYKDTPESPVYGTGQGSKSSPPIWANNCSIYFDIYDEYCHGAHYFDAFSSLRITLGMVGFVDDNKCQTNCHPRNRHTLAQRATDDGQLWSDILDASGGGLEHPKLLYYWRQTEFYAHGFPILKEGTFGDPIVFHDEHGVPTEIEQRSVYKAYKTLGTYQSIGGAQKTQANELIKRSHRLVRVLATSSCSKNASWQFYTAVYNKSIGYPLATSRLRPKQIDTIQGPMVSLILNRIGYPRRLSRCLTFGPRRYGGLGLPSAHTHICHAEVSMFIRHLRNLGTARNPHQPNILLRININRLQACAGVDYPILEFPGTSLPHLEGSWLPHFRSTLARIRGSAQVADIQIPSLQRGGDSYLMVRALAAPTISKREVQMIQLCRYYFDGAVTMSDICNAAGTALAPGILSGGTLRLSSRSIGEEPYQERPGPRAWAAWRKFLRLLCSDHYGSLRAPLGDWLCPAPALRRRWPFVFSRRRDCLYRWCNHEYEELPFKRPMIYTFSPQDGINELPEDSVPVDVDIVSDGWRVRAVGSCAMAPSHSPVVLAFDEYLDTLPENERVHLLRYDLMNNELFEICHAIHDLSNTLLVTDGGADKDYGSYGWVLATKQGRRLARGSGAVFGINPKSYRAEISGCKGGLLFLIHLFAYCEQSIPGGHLNYYCDNQAFTDKLASFRSFRLASVSGCLDAEWDLLISIHSLMQKFPDLPIVTHVKGHQDRKKPYDELLLQEQLNVDADAVATYEMSHFGDTKRSVPFDPICRVLFSIDGTTITRDYEDAIQDSLYFADLRGYIRTRFQWSLSTFNAIDWDSFHSVYSKYARTRTFFYKFGWKKLPVGDRLHRREERFDHRCPTCLQPDETDDHLTQCLHPDRQRWRQGLIVGLSSYFGNKPELVAIRFPDKQVHCGKYGYSYIEDSYCNLAATQSQIGWDQFLRGKFAHDWQRLQFRYAVRFGFVDKSKQWHLWLIRFLANNTYDLWSQRNRHRHGSDSKSQQDKALAQAKRDVSDLYHQKTKVLPQDRNLFSIRLKDHLLQGLSNLKNWLTLNKGLIQYSVRKAEANAKKNKNKMTKYYAIRPQRRRALRPPATSRRKRTFRSRHLTQFFKVQATTRPQLDPVPEFLPLFQDAPRPLLGQRRLKDFFPDHPG